MKSVLHVAICLAIMSCATTGKDSGKKATPQPDAVKKSQPTSSSAVKPETTSPEIQKEIPEKGLFKTLTCKLRDHERSLSIQPGDETGCKVIYKKWGNEKQVANARFNLNVCKEVYDKIKGNLEEAGFVCTLVK